jgi:hypothetical protein
MDILTMVVRIQRIYSPWWWWLGSKCRKCQTAVSSCIDLNQLLHLEPLTHRSLNLVVRFQRIYDGG